MNKPKRLRRNDPLRQRPIRNPSTYFRESNSWQERTSDSAPPPSEEQNPFDSLDDVVTNGVKLGYEVIEKYLLQGQKVAEGIHNGSSEEDSKEGNVHWLLSSMLRLNRDMAGFWIDAIEAFVQNPEFLLGLMGAARSNGVTSSSNNTREPGSSANGASARVAVEIESRRRTQVTVDLRPSPSQNVPHVHALNAPPNLGIPPLTEVSFRWDRESATPIVQLKIPDKQPTALYTGVVLDPKTNEVRGTLCVRILD
ncbi:hypothetical protein [Candidatus Nitrospira allomarina]|uniref:Uncharacterized protein n=1 Tax=Candidatus Nitrospira allomarina TaxID=3020900 RepID=A0AA96GCN7_9BACT|nr:hypothetical protein [Candidatus Nitrospira allomarina]WNM58612.1 hypothetical protein PP769_02265 [Candidatus Nitrospira allomarina]